ncbi:unnamed protein product [Peronospora farinosa]|uniref:Uncharacterized protein n=1 Tax=Peronospora farinosa TaxID=134698 RepID=A0AAV0SPT7_9STRA|nr:unnamed protein product [Peronospora farinosa]CAI5705223.1 unnamed protein product [Peronospora farinosa]
MRPSSTGSTYPATSVATERFIHDVLRPSSYSSHQVIDLTLDDDEDDEEKPIDSQIAQESVTTESATSSDSDAFKLSGLHEMDNKVTDETTFERIMPLIEDVESDVDEEWPHVATNEPFVVNNQVSYRQTQEDVQVTLNAIAKTIPLSFNDKQTSFSNENEEEKVTRHETLTLSLNNDRDNAMEVEEDEKVPKQVVKANECSVTTTDQVVSMESLEDGEIFEEGVSLKPMMQMNTVKHQKAGNGSSHLVDAMNIRPHLRSKKQKKRGKKKTKRKLEAMQMMHASPSQMYPVYERTIRQRPLADAPPPGHCTLAMMRGEPRGKPINARPVFQDASPALFHAGDLRVGVPHPPNRPTPQQRSAYPLPPQQRPSRPHIPQQRPDRPLPPQQRPARPLPPQQRPARPLPPQQRPARPLPPPYEDSQILRVNRQGSMEMINGEAKLSSRPIISEPLHGGFKYRPVSMFPPPPVSNGPDIPLQRSACDSSRLPPVLKSGGGNIKNSVASTGRGESGDVDLDSLRAAALRTKMKRSLQQMERTTETVSVVQSTPSTLGSSSKPAHCEGKQVKATSPEIDKLRFDILRSMTKNRNRTTSTKALNASSPILQVTEPNAIEKPNESGINKTTKSNTLAAQGDPSASKDPSEYTLTHMSARANGIGSSGPSSETDKSTTTSVSDQVVSKTASQLAMFAEKAKPSAQSAASTPEFRPLTASSQSLVIQLGPDDFLPRKSKDDAAMSSGLQDAIKEMRRKIAEREKEQTNRLLASGATGLSKPLPSPALSSPSSQSNVSSVVTQLLSATVAVPGVNSPGTNSVKDSSAGINVDRLLCAQTEANQATKKVMKEVLHSPSETFSSLDIAKSAAGRASPLKPALEPQERSDISRVSTIVDTYVLPPVLQHQLQTRSGVRNGDPARELCVKKSIEPVSVV